MTNYLAEAIGTFVSVFGGLGSAILAGSHTGCLGVGFAFGLSLVYSIGSISGCHINPAVTLGVLLVKKINPKHAFGYMAAQTTGALVGAGLLLLIAKGAMGGYDASVAGFGTNGYGEHSRGQYSMVTAIVSEIVLTALLVLTVLGATDIKAPVGFAGVTIGFVLVVIHLVGIPVTNASVNPARRIASATFVGGWAMRQLWLFIVAPFIGSAVAVSLYNATRVPAALITTPQAERALASEQVERRKSA